MTALRTGTPATAPRTAGAAVLVAAVLDAILGEPPAALHPVVGMGRYLGCAGRATRATPPSRAFVTGGLAWAVGAAGTVATATVVDRAARRLPAPFEPWVVGLALWPLLSGRMLLAEVAGVEAGLATGTEEGRRAVARLVSRETGGLGVVEVRSAALESLAENLSDALVATLWWYVVAGLPGAALHRFANTADAMWGYRTPRWEHAGKVAARADDLLNLVPARLTAVLLAEGRPAVLRAARAAARRTPSPNAGWPMGALAHRLDVRLAKPGVHTLHPAGRHPERPDIAKALALARRSALIAFAVAALPRRPFLHRHRGAA